MGKILLWLLVGIAATVLLFLAGHRALEQDGDPTAATSSAITPSIPPPPPEIHPPPETHQGFLYGRITTADGATYEGRLRWGGDEEAFWGDYFNGSKDENPWAAHASLEGSPDESPPIKIFGFEIARGEPEIDLGRPLSLLRQ